MNFQNIRNCGMSSHDRIGPPMTRNNCKKQVLGNFWQKIRWTNTYSSRLTRVVQNIIFDRKKNKIQLRDRLITFLLYVPLDFADQIYNIFFLIQKSVLCKAPMHKLTEDWLQCSPDFYASLYKKTCKKYFFSCLWISTTNNDFFFFFYLVEERGQPVANFKLI